MPVSLYVGGRLKFSLSTGTLYIYPLPVVFRWARAAGFEGVELVVNPEAIVRGGRAVRQLAEAEGVEIFSVHPSVVPLPGWRERHGGMDSIIRLAEEAGAGVVVMHTPRSESLDAGEGLAFRQQIEASQPRLAGTGLLLAVENKAIRADAERHFVLSPLARLRAFADRYDLDLVLDTTHAGTAGEDLVHARQAFGGRLANVHLSDMGGSVPLAGLPGAQRLLGEHRFPGAGDLPLAGLLADLAGQGYAGPITLEVNPFEVPAWWPPAVRRRLAQAVTWMRRATSDGATTDEPVSAATRQPAPR
jgi:sugar phosphate isomerase/epimerase